METTTGAGRPGGYEATWADPAAAEEYECPICKQVRCWQKCHYLDSFFVFVR